MQYIMERFIDRFRPGDNVTDAYSVAQLRSMVASGHVRLVADEIDEPKPDDNTVDYASMTVAELRVIAAAAGVSGASSLKKSELIEAVSNG